MIQIFENEVSTKKDSVTSTDIKGKECGEKIENIQENLAETVEKKAMTNKLEAKKAVANSNAKVNILSGNRIFHAFIPWEYEIF